MNDSSDLEISDLEKELELEMEDVSTSDTEADEELDSDNETVEIESEGESQEDQEFNDALETLQESENFEVEGEADEGDNEAPDDFAQRFYELSTRQFENDADLDHEVNGLLNEMERQYFWGGLKKRLKQGLKLGAKGLLSKAMKFGQGLPAFKSITQLARGNLKGALTSLAKQGLSAAVRMNPAAAAGLSALKGLGFNPLGDEEANREAWDNYTHVAREAYDHLADNLNETSDHPLEANRQAAAAFQSGLAKVQHRRRHHANGGAGHKGKVHRIRVRSGQKIKLIIEGI